MPLNTWALVGLSLLLAAGPVLALDGGVLDGLPRSGEHRALQTQVQLLRKEAEKERPWHLRDKADRLKDELKQVQAVLDEVELIYGERLAGCRAYWMDQSVVKDPRVGAHPGYYGCNEKVWVTDEMVRLVRRKHEVRARLKDTRLTTSTRAELQAEQRLVEGKLDKLAGNTPLFLEYADLPGVDGGPDAVPEGRPRTP